jgi:acyl carrier protein
MSSKIADQALFEDLRSLFAEVFRVEPSQIEPDAQLGEWPVWDSMAHMDLMLALESRFGVEINAETISQLTSIPAILAYLETHGRDRK